MACTRAVRRLAACRPGGAVRRPRLVCRRGRVGAAGDGALDRRADRPRQPRHGASAGPPPAATRSLGVNDIGLYQALIRDGADANRTGNWEEAAALFRRAVELQEKGRAATARPRSTPSPGWPCSCPTRAGSPRRAPPSPAPRRWPPAPMPPMRRCCRRGSPITAASTSSTRATRRRRWSCCARAERLYAATLPEGVVETASQASLASRFAPTQASVAAHRARQCAAVARCVRAGSAARRHRDTAQPGDRAARARRQRRRGRRRRQRRGVRPRPGPDQRAGVRLRLPHRRRNRARRRPARRGGEQARRLGDGLHPRPAAHPVAGRDPVPPRRGAAQGRQAGRGRRRLPDRQRVVARPQAGDRRHPAAALPGGLCRTGAQRRRSAAAAGGDVRNRPAQPRRHHRRANPAGGGAAGGGARGRPRAARPRRRRRQARRAVAAKRRAGQPGRRPPPRRASPNSTPRSPRPAARWRRPTKTCRRPCPITTRWCSRRCRPPPCSACCARARPSPPPAWARPRAGPSCCATM